MTLRALIIDDEVLARTRLRRLLAEHPDLTIVGEASSAAEASQLVGADAAIDVLFVDVELPGCSGVELVRSLSPRPAIVFATAHAHYAVDAFDESAVDYLLKPVTSERLRRALHRVRCSLRRRNPEMRDPAPGVRHRLAVRNKTEVAFVDPLEILWVAAEGNYCLIHTRNGTYSIRQLIGELAERLGDGPFMRIHRSAIVNTEMIRKIVGTYDDGYTIVLVNDTSVRVGTSYAQTVRTLLERAR